MVGGGQDHREPEHLTAAVRVTAAVRERDVSRKSRYMTFSRDDGSASDFAPCSPLRLRERCQNGISCNAWNPSGEAPALSLSHTAFNSSSLSPSTKVTPNGRADRPGIMTQIMPRRLDRGRTTRSCG